MEPNLQELADSAGAEDVEETGAEVMHEEEEEEENEEDKEDEDEAILDRNPVNEDQQKDNSTAGYNARSK